MSAFKDELAPAVAGFQMEISHQGTTSTLKLLGECDIAEHDRLRKALRDIIAQRPECLLLDLSQLSFIDSTGISAVIGLKDQAEREGVRLVICPGPYAVQHVFEVTGMIPHLPFLPPDGSGRSGRTSERATHGRRPAAASPPTDSPDVVPVGFGSDPSAPSAGDTTAKLSFKVK